MASEIGSTRWTSTSAHWDGRAPFAGAEGLEAVITTGTLVVVGMVALGAITVEYAQTKYRDFKAEDLDFSDPSYWLKSAAELDNAFDTLDRKLARKGGVCYDRFWHPGKYFEGKQLAVAIDWKTQWRQLYRGWKRYYDERRPTAKDRAAQREQFVNIFDRDTMDPSDTKSMLQFSGALVLYQGKAQELCPTAPLAVPYDPSETAAINEKVNEASKEGVKNALNFLEKFSDTFTTVAWILGILVVGKLVLDLSPAIQTASRTGAEALQQRYGRQQALGAVALTRAESRRRVAALRRRGCKVWYEPVPGGMAVMKRCP